GRAARPLVGLGLAAADDVAAGVPLALDRGDPACLQCHLAHRPAADRPGRPDVADRHLHGPLHGRAYRQGLGARHAGCRPVTETLTLSPLIAWVGALSLLLNFGLSLWGLLNSGARQNKLKLDELDARIGRHETRLGGVEQSLRSLPSAGDLHKIELALSRMEGELGIMGQRLQPV